MKDYVRITRTNKFSKKRAQTTIKGLVKPSTNYQTTINEIDCFINPKVEIKKSAQL